MWYEHWFDKTIANKIDMIIRTGKVKMVEGRLEVQTSQFTKPFWLHVGASMNCRNCVLWQEIFFTDIGIIHSFCRYHCWKCVTRPRNVREMIQLYNLMNVVPFVYNFINPLPGKAGVDVRHQTSEAYGVFQYATSLEEALKIKEIMTYMIRTYLPSEEIEGKYLQDTVFVKRSCTEMEEKIPGDNPWWETPQTRDEVEIERRLEEIFSRPNHIVVQPGWLRDKVLHNWLAYANAIGDKSAVNFIGSDPFNVHSRKYTFKDLQKGGDPKPAPSKKTEKKRKKSKEKK